MLEKGKTEKHEEQVQFAAYRQQTHKEKAQAAETLYAEIDQLEASIAKPTEDITELTKAVAGLDVAMAKALSRTLRKEFDAALAYFDKLKPSCVDVGVDYEDRVACRKEEMSLFRRHSRS